ncbi:MAG TPA: nicotinate-nucleotide adenylyltransferase [Pyrinomonadaceae bacterium]|jgi:nicotinate-nucleotide adenylyltransferase
MKRIAFYGGSFDPVHCGHLTIARTLTEIFELDEFVFIPAFHAPHKKRKKPTSAFHRFAMLALSTAGEAKIKVSKMELEMPEKPYTVETLTRLENELPDERIFFVMGADSWAEITTWREWETVLTCVNIIVVTRPDYEIDFSHVTDEIRERIVDLRGNVSNFKFQISSEKTETGNRKSETIYITDAVQLDISATEIRRQIRENRAAWRELVPEEVAKYVEKYQIYK